MINWLREALGLTDWIDTALAIAVALLALSVVQWLVQWLVFNPARDRRQARLFDEGRSAGREDLLVGIHRAVEDIHQVVCEGVKEGERADAGAR